MRSLVLWITGLPGSGKSTIADAVKQRHPGFVVLRMDDLRKVVTPRPTYSEEERDLVYRSLVFSAKLLAGLGRDVIIDATGNRRQWRDLCRAEIPGCAEVYLRCSLGVCEEREQKRTDRRSAPGHIYEKGKAGWPVPGVTVAYEEPLSPELTIDTETTGVQEAADLIDDLLTAMRPSVTRNE